MYKNGLKLSSRFNDYELREWLTYVPPKLAPALNDVCRDRKQRINAIGDANSLTTVCLATLCAAHSYEAGLMALLDIYTWLEGDIGAVPPELVDTIHHLVEIAQDRQKLEQVRDLLRDIA